MKSALLLVFLSFAQLSFTQNTLQEGIDLYNKRAENRTGLKANAATIDQAIAKLTIAYNDPKTEEQAGAYLIRCYNYKGRFVATDKKQKEAIFSKGKEIGEKLIKKYPKSAPVVFEYVCIIGLWADVSGVMQAAWDGVLGKMKDQTEQLYKLDETYAGAAGPMILGLLYAEAPYVPLFLTWPNNDKAKELMEKALKIAPDEFGNNYHYAELMVKLDKPEVAKKYLNHVLEMPPRPRLLLEDMQYQADAKNLLAKIK